MSTREELQAEHVAQITWQLRSRGVRGRVGGGWQEEDVLGKRRGLAEEVHCYWAPLVSRREQVWLNMIVFKVTTFSGYGSPCGQLSGLWSLWGFSPCQTFLCITQPAASSAQPGLLRVSPPPPPPSAWTCFNGEVERLDDGVPVEIVLDVVGLHAMHLEGPGRYHVLLVHLCMVSWRKQASNMADCCFTLRSQSFWVILKFLNDSSPGFWYFLWTIWLFFTHFQERDYQWMSLYCACCLQNRQEYIIII